jgi:multiple sugar transport system permease protein
LSILFLFRFIWTFNKFDDIFLLTRGQAGTEVLTIKVYDYAFGEFDIGASSATAMVLFGVLSVFLLIYFRWIAKESDV